MNNSKVSVVTYDVGKKKSRQNVVKNSYNLLLVDQTPGLDENIVKRLAENPFDSLETPTQHTGDSNESNA